MKKIILSLFLSISLVTMFGQSKERSFKKDFGKNIIAFNPMHLITNDFVGIGVSYERLVNEYLGLKVPVMMAINNPYFNIGLEAKLYPTKNTGSVKYAIAPTIMAGIGNRRWTERYYNQSGNSVLYTYNEPASHIGFLLNQTLNVTISRQAYIGLDGGIGINYYDERVRNNNYNDNNLSFAAQLHVGLGYRF